MSDIVLFTDWLYCIDLFSCKAASLFNKLTYLLTCVTVQWQVTGMMNVFITFLNVFFIFPSFNVFLLFLQCFISMNHLLCRLSGTVCAVIDNQRPWLYWKYQCYIFKMTVYKNGMIFKRIMNKKTWTRSRMKVRPTVFPHPHALDFTAAAGRSPRRASSQLITSQWKPTTTAISQYS